MKKLILTLTLAASMAQPVQANPKARAAFLAGIVGAAVATRLYDGQEVQQLKKDIRRLRAHKDAMSPHVRQTAIGVRGGELINIEYEPRCPENKN